jgi:hypothetical protein
MIRHLVNKKRTGIGNNLLPNRGSIVDLLLSLTASFSKLSVQFAEDAQTAQLSSARLPPGTPTSTFQTAKSRRRFAGNSLRLRHNHLGSEVFALRTGGGRGYPPLNICSFPQRVCREFDVGSPTNSVGHECISENVRRLTWARHPCNANSGLAATAPDHGASANQHAEKPAASLADPTTIPKPRCCSVDCPAGSGPCTEIPRASAPCPLSRAA